MAENSENIIKAISDNTVLSNEEINCLIEEKREELQYFLDDDTIPRLVAQELCVNIRDCSDYLHSILEFIEEPVRVYFYVFPSTRSKKCDYQNLGCFNGPKNWFENKSFIH